MEALKHTEWTFGVLFFWFAFYRIDLSLIWLIIILIGSQIPDFLELLFFRLKLSKKLARKITHDYIIVFLLWLVFPFGAFPEISLFTTSIAIHYLVDLFSGLEPIYIAGLLFGEHTAALYVTSDHRIAIGKRIERWGSKYLQTETEDPTPELAWFWVMQLSGVIFCGIGIIIYLVS
ncbi:MAG: hypothetical protein ACXAC8_03725 [Candidatus Hodarchaeales archaeon]|jgi:hypothetical protein